MLTFLSVLVIIGAMVAALIIFFKIRTVTVTGESRYPPGEIVEASGIEAGQNMFLFNKFTAISRIFAAHPYLDEISIRRRLPDGVEIIITQCQPVAVLDAETILGSGETQSTGRGYYLIDIKGKLLERVDSPPAGASLVLVRGTSLKNPEVGKYADFGDEQKQKPLFLVLNSLKDHDILPNIGFIDLTETYNITFEYTDKFVVKLGTTEGIDSKIRYIDMIIERLSEGDRGTIDVSSPDTGVRFVPDKS